MLIGRQIGRYKILRKIGVGGMGEVYLAHDAQLNRTVALKILSGEFSNDDLSRHGRETHLIREKLSQIETRLDPKIFMRIHRSTIVNLDRIKSLHPMFNGDQLIIFKNGQELNLSRAYYVKLMLRITS